jgi:hypothetical protein
VAAGLRVVSGLWFGEEKRGPALWVASSGDISRSAEDVLRLPSQAGERHGMKLRYPRLIDLQPPSDLFHGEFLLIIEQHDLLLALGDPCKRPAQNFSLLSAVAGTELMPVVVSSQRVFMGRPLSLHSRRAQGP